MFAESRRRGRIGAASACVFLERSESIVSSLGPRSERVALVVHSPVLWRASDCRAFDLHAHEVNHFVQSPGGKYDNRTGGITSLTAGSESQPPCNRLVELVLHSLRGSMRQFEDEFKLLGLIFANPDGVPSLVDA
jgi:hypothetical protein